MCCEILKIIVDFLALVLEIGTIVFAIVEFAKFKRENYNGRLRNLRQEIAAYHCMADCMAEEIAKLRPNSQSKKTIKSEFLDKAVNHEDNIARVRPSKSAKEMYS
ncbi:MAG: hypothetical protein J5980_05720 [Muribaculaceae bacterium]|nr:hypothetical protein [Muribaculaceae bacterium]